MRYKFRNAFATFALLMVVVACGSVPTESPVAAAASVPVTVITDTGFGGGSGTPGLVAAPSLTDLLGLVHGLGFYPSLDECTRVPQFRPQCWLDVKDPGSSLLVAAYVDVPCTLTQSVTAALSLPTEVTITVVSTPACQNGGELPAAHLSLLAIPLTLLPVDEVTVNALHTGISVRTAKMMVDLRRPLNFATDMQARTNEFDAATTEATNDALTRVPPGQTVSFVAFGTNRWTDTSLGCPGSSCPTDNCPSCARCKRRRHPSKRRSNRHWCPPRHRQCSGWKARKRFQCVRPATCRCPDRQR